MKKEFQIKSEKFFFDSETMELYQGYCNEEAAEEAVEESQEENKLKVVTFLVTNACNGKCKYCYEEPGKECMDEEAAEKALRELKKYGTHIGKARFFGGEPLIDFSVIQYIVGKLKSDFIVDGFEITTNSVLMTDEMLDFFVENNFSIVVSLDGPQNLHDALRIGCSHDIVFKNVLKIRNSHIGSKLSVNCTYTKYHQDHISLEELENYFEKLGVHYTISNVITDNEELALVKTKSMLEEQKEFVYVSLDKLYANSLDTSISDYVTRVIYALVEKKYCDCFCEELCSGMAFDVDGEKYACTRLIKKCRVDDDTLKEKNAKNSPMCKECWARGFCGYCTATIYLDGVVPYTESYCEKKVLYEYAMQAVLECLYCDPDRFQAIVDNFYD